MAPIHAAPGSRLAGVLYAVIIACGVGAEVGVRSALVDHASAAATQRAVADNLLLFRTSVVMDVVMIVCDVAVAVLLHRALRHVGATLSAAAATFRLVQAATLAANVVNQVAAATLAANVQEQLDIVAAGGDAPAALDDVTPTASLVLLFAKVHAVGYDVGLVFFAVNCWLTAVLFKRLPGVAHRLWLPLMASGVVYCVGSLVALLTPHLHATLEPLYIVPLVSEVATSVALATGSVTYTVATAPAASKQQ